MEDKHTKTLHVLFADDDSDEAYLFNEAIEQLGFSIIISKAHDGKNLMEILLTSKEALPDLIFLDLNMPHKDGIETLKEIRANDRYKDLNVLIFSNSSNKINTEACYEFGADLYIVKPETFEQMMKLVKKIYSIDWKEQKRLRSKEGFLLRSYS